MRQWYETYGLGDKNLTAHKLTIYNLRNSDNSSPGEVSSCVMGTDEARGILTELLPLPFKRLICLGVSDGQYRVILENDTCVHLGPYLEMEKQATWRKLLFKHARIGWTAVKTKQWNMILGALAALTETENDDDSNSAAETRHWIQDFSGDTTKAELTYETLYGDRSFYQDGAIHVSLSALLRHGRIRYGGEHTNAARTPA